MSPCWLPVTCLFISSAQLNGHDSFFKEWPDWFGGDKEAQEMERCFCSPPTGQILLLSGFGE